MKHILETNEISRPLEININGQALVAVRWKAKMIDGSHEPYFGMGFRQDIGAEPSAETQITLTFRGLDAHKIREEIQGIIMRNGGGDGRG